MNMIYYSCTLQLPIWQMSSCGLVGCTLKQCSLSHTHRYPGLGCIYVYANIVWITHLVRLYTWMSTGSWLLASYSVTKNWSKVNFNDYFTRVYSPVASMWVARLPQQVLYRIWQYISMEAPFNDYGDGTGRTGPVLIYQYFFHLLSVQQPSSWRHWQW